MGRHAYCMRNKCRSFAPVRPSTLMRRITVQRGAKMLIQLETKESCTTIALHGQFVFDTHRDFRDASTRALQEASQEIQIDLSKLGYMDSSALGMLLVFN